MTESGSVDAIASPILVVSPGNTSVVSNGEATENVAGTKGLFVRSEQEKITKVVSMR